GRLTYYKFTPRQALLAVVIFFLCVPSLCSCGVPWGVRRRILRCDHVALPCCTSHAENGEHSARASLLHGEVRRRVTNTKGAPTAVCSMGGFHDSWSFFVAVGSKFRWMVHIAWCAFQFLSVLDALLERTHAGTCVMIDGLYKYCVTFAVYAPRDVAIHPPQLHQILYQFSAENMAIDR
ncbi:unnamed protein product, partial [Hapterophycus canaliculatus]